MISAMNYAAQAARDLLRQPNEKVVALGMCIKNAQHFCLPDGGRIIDSKLRGLVGLDTMRLPYKFITLEWYDYPEAGQEDQTFTSPRHVVYAQETDEIAPSGNPYLCVFDCHWYIAKQRWVAPIMGVRFDPRVGSDPDIFLENVQELHLKEEQAKEQRATLGDKLHDEVVRGFMASSIFAVLNFIEALSCKNVMTQVHQRDGGNKNVRRVRDGKLPLWESKILVIRPTVRPRSVATGTSHASPAEHLRCGHIKRQPYGNHWYQSTIVNPGVGRRVDKIYQVPRRAA